MITFGVLLLVIGMIIAFIAAFVEGAWHNRLIAMTLFCLCLGIALMSAGDRAIVDLRGAR